MRSFTTVVALASVVPAVMSLTINTPPSVIQCQPELLGWKEGVPPYYPNILPGGQPSAPPIQSFDMQTGNSLTWTVNLPAGTKITLAVKDSTGAVAYSDIVTVQPGPDSSCLGSSGGQPQPAPPPAAQDVSVSNALASSAPTSGVSTPVSSSAVVVQTGTIRPSSGASGVTASRASVASVASSATQSVSRTSASPRVAATSSSSGAESILIGNSYGFVGVVGLIGALFL